MLFEQDKAKRIAKREKETEAFWDSIEKRRWKVVMRNREKTVIDCETGQIAGQLASYPWKLGTILKAPRGLGIMIAAD